MEKIRLNNCDCTLDFIQSAGLENSYSLTKIENGYIVLRTVKNTSEHVLTLNELQTKLTGLSFGGVAEADYYYANENARLFCQLTIPLDYNRMNGGAKENVKYGLPVNRRWNDPGVQEGRICTSPYQPFPAILLSNYESKYGVVCGSLSQDVFCHNFEVGHENGKAFLTVYSSFKDIAYRELKPQEELVDLFYVGETANAEDINHVFDYYVELLREYLFVNAGASQTNRHTLIWDSWNDGIYRDVSEEMLLREARVIKKLFPNVEWFQLDDGYATYCHEDVDLDAHGLGVPYEGASGIDAKKFPNGLKAYTDKIKEIGLKPAIWIGGFCPIKSKIYQEKPEWFLDYTYRIDFSQPLDVSQPQVREYICSAVDTFICEYGFEGIKHDFWSYAFEDRHDLLSNKDKSGYEYREWWHDQLRSRLPAYGYLETGCDLSMGNPFIGKYFNNYRFGLDVGAGKWDNIKTTMFWALAVLTTHTGDLFIPNSDSIGLLPGLNDKDFMFIVNFQVITRTLVEISGRFSKVDENNPRLQVIKRATKYLNNGENVYFAKYDYRRKGERLPEIIYINSAFDEPSNDYITVAIFNADEEAKEIRFAPTDVGLPLGEYDTEDVWKGENRTFKEFSFILQPHESRLLKIKK